MSLVSVISRFSKGKKVYRVLCATFSLSIRSVSMLASNISALPRADITSLSVEFFLSSSIASEFELQTAMTNQELA